jgi:hypothetical protein
MAQLELGSQPAGASFSELGGVLPGNPVITRDTDALHRMDSIDQTTAIRSRSYRDSLLISAIDPKQTFE